MNRTLLVAVAPVLFAIASIACNGQVDDDGEGSGSTASRSQAGAEEEAAKKKANPPPSSTSGSQGSTVTTEPACSYEYGSSSGGSSGTPGVNHYMCESVHHYTCGADAREVTVSCDSNDGKWSQGTFSCNGNTYPFDCATGCSLSAAEYAKCNLPEPDDQGGGGGGSSSGSSSSSSGISSSSSSSGG